MVNLTEELRRNSDFKLDDLQMFKEWYSQQQHLPPITDEHLLLFLHSTYYKMEEAKAAVESYFTVRTEDPEMFTERDPDTTDMKNGTRISEFLMLPKQTDEGYTVMWYHLNLPDSSEFKFLETLRTFTMATDVHLHQHGTSKGFLIVVDMTGITLGHLWRLSPGKVRTLMRYLQDALPVRLKGLHFINAVSIMDAVLAIIKPFMKKELHSMLFIHAKGAESLHATVPMQMIPVEYGGSEISLPEISAMRVAEQRSNRDWLQTISQLRVDDSKRVKTKKSTTGVFRKLEID